MSVDLQPVALLLQEEVTCIGSFLLHPSLQHHMQDFLLQELTASNHQIASLQSVSQSAAAQLEDTQQQLTALQDSSADLQQQLSQASADLKQANVQHQQEMQDLHSARQEVQQSHADQLAQLESKLQTADAANNEAATAVAELQAKLEVQAGAHQERAAGKDVHQQHADSLAALQEELAELQNQLAAAKEAKASMHTQLDTALSVQAQHADRTESLVQEIASLKQELDSRESRPEAAPGDLQQQLNSARADADKQGKKLAQAEMRASLVRQQLQEAHYQLRQLEAKAQHQPQPDDLQESLDRANTELDMLQGRLSPIEGQVRGPGVTCKMCSLFMPRSAFSIRVAEVLNCPALHCSWADVAFLSVLCQKGDA